MSLLDARGDQRMPSYSVVQIFCWIFMICQTNNTCDGSLAITQTYVYTSCSTGCIASPEVLYSVGLDDSETNAMENSQTTFHYNLLLLHPYYEYTFGFFIQEENLR